MKANRLPPRSLAFLIVIVASTLYFANAAPPEYKGIIKGPWGDGAAAKNATDTPMVAVDVTGLPDGDYVLSMKSGVVNIRPFTLLTPSEIPIPPGPSPTPVPVPTPANDRTKLFQDAAAKVAGDSSREDNAKKLAALYRVITGYARPSGTTPPQVTSPAVLKALTSQATDALLAPAAKTSWQPFRDTLGTQWTLLDAKAGVTIEDYAKLMDDAAAGLDASAPNKKAIDPATLQMIIQLVLTLLKLFFPM